MYAVLATSVYTEVCSWRVLFALARRGTDCPSSHIVGFLSMFLYVNSRAILIVFVIMHGIVIMHCIRVLS